MNMCDFLYIVIYLELFLKNRRGDIQEDILKNIDLFITN